MKKKSLWKKIKEFDSVEFFHVMIYSIGIFATSIIVLNIPLAFFPNLSKIISSIILLIIYLALLFSSSQFLTDKKFKKRVKYFSYFLLVAYLYVIIIKYFT